MNRRETNRVTMFQSVLTVLAGHEATVTAYDPLAELYPRLQTSVAAIMTADREYLEIITGITAAKRNAETAMVERALHVAKALNALAVKTGNEPLRAETRICRSGLLHLRESATLQNCIRIGEIAGQYTGDLERYGITAATLGTLDSAIERMRTALADKVLKNAERKTARQRLTRAFAVAGTMVKSELDTLVALVKEQDPALYDEYQAVRGIRNLGGTRGKSVKAPDASGEVQLVA